MIVIYKHKCQKLFHCLFSQVGTDFKGGHKMNYNNDTKHNNIITYAIWHKIMFMYFFFIRLFYLGSYAIKGYSNQSNYYDKMF